MYITALPAADVPQYRVIMLRAYEHAADSKSRWVNLIADALGLTVAFGAFAQSEVIEINAIYIIAK